MSALIEFDQVCKYYQMGDTLVKAADHITMKIEKGEFVAIVGQSGSGKSTCMNIIGCLDVPTYGITHDNSIAVQAERIIRLEDGQVVYDGDAHAPEAVVQPTLSGEAAQEEAK